MRNAKGQFIKGTKPSNGFKKGVPSHNKGKKNWWKSPSVFKRGDNSLEKHPNWKGGISKIDKKVRCLPEYKLWRTRVFERDNWTCQTCRVRGVYVTAHHIKSFASIIKNNDITDIYKALDCADLWDISNGVTLCEECHSLTDNYKGRNKSIGNSKKRG